MYKINSIKILSTSLFCAALLSASGYTIVGPESPKPYETTAIKELTEYLAKRVKGELTVGGRTDIVFHVGDTELVKSKGLVSSALPDEKWIVKSFGNQVLVNGGGTRGALYATYHFLEDCCDIHWWSDFEEYVPEASPLVLPKLNMSGRPFFRYRNIHRGTVHDQEMTAVRNRLNANGAHFKFSSAVGGSIEYGSPGWAHTFANYITKEEFFKEHPEFFALIGGERCPGPGGQLCLSNSELPAIFADKMCEYIRKDREEAAKEGKQYPIYYDVSMNDVTNPCSCKDCSDYAKQYGYSAQLIEFLNDISRRVSPKFPDIYITTLAYYYNESPPKNDIRAGKNILIRLCDTTSNQALSLLHPENAAFQTHVREWNRHADNLLIWDYGIVYSDVSSAYPFASELYLGDAHKFYRDNNVTGIFWEHEREYWADMFEYKFFLECKLMENPDADLTKLQNIFMTRYYGAAAPLILEYRRMLDKMCRDNKGGFAAWPVHYTSFSFIRDLDSLNAIMDAAEKAVKGDELLMSRVRRARFGLDLLCIQRHNRIRRHGYADQKENDAALERAVSRIRTDWRKWTESYPDKDFRRSVDAVLAEYESRGRQTPLKTVPEEFKGRAFLYVRPEECSLYGTAVSLVDDDESRSGKAIKVNSKESHYYELPYGMGCYDLAAKKNIASFSMKTVSEKAGYTWYKMGRVTMTENCELFFSRAWTTKIQISFPETIGKTFDVWAELKFVGPMYHQNQQGDSNIFLGLVVLEEKQ